MADEFGTPLNVKLSTAEAMTAVESLIKAIGDADQVLSAWGTKADKDVAKVGGALGTLAEQTGKTVGAIRGQFEKLDIVTPFRAQVEALEAQLASITVAAERAVAGVNRAMRSVQGPVGLKDAFLMTQPRTAARRYFDRSGEDVPAWLRAEEEAARRAAVMRQKAKTAVKDTITSGPRQLSDYPAFTEDEWAAVETTAARLKERLPASLQGMISGISPMATLRGKPVERVMSDIRRGVIDAGGTFDKASGQIEVAPRAVFSDFERTIEDTLSHEFAHGMLTPAFSSPRATQAFYQRIGLKAPEQQQAYMDAVDRYLRTIQQQYRRGVKIEGGKPNALLPNLEEYAAEALAIGGLQGKGSLMQRFLVQPGLESILRAAGGAQPAPEVVGDLRSVLQRLTGRGSVIPAPSASTTARAYTAPSPTVAQGALWGVLGRSGVTPANIATLTETQIGHYLQKLAYTMQAVPSGRQRPSDVMRGFAEVDQEGRVLGYRRVLRSGDVYEYKANEKRRGLGGYDPNQLRQVYDTEYYDRGFSDKLLGRDAPVRRQRFRTTDFLGHLVEQGTQLFARNGREIGGQLSVFNEAGKIIERSGTQVETAMGRFNFGRHLKFFTEGTLIYMTMGQAIQFLARSFSDTVRVMGQFETAQARISFIMGQSKVSDAGYMRGGAQAIGRISGVLPSQVAGAWEEASQAAKNPADQYLLMTSAARLAVITGQPVEEMQKRLTAVVKQNNLAWKDLPSVLDTVAAAYKRANVPIKEVLATLAEGGALKETFGLDPQRFAMFVGAAVEATNKTADEVRSMFAMVGQRMYQPEQAQKLWGAAGVGVFEKGSFNEVRRPVYDVLSELAEKWDSLNQTQKQKASEAMTGVRNANYAALETMLRQWRDIHAKMDDITRTSNGEFSDLYGRMADTFTMHTQRMGAAWENFLLSMSNTDLAKGGVDLLTGLFDNLANAASNANRPGGEGIMGKLTGGLGFAGGAGLGIAGVLGLMALTSPAAPVSWPLIIAAGLAGGIGGTALMGAVQPASPETQERKLAEVVQQLVQTEAQLAQLKLLQEQQAKLPNAKGQADLAKAIGELEKKRAEQLASVEEQKRQGTTMQPATVAAYDAILNHEELTRQQEAQRKRVEGERPSQTPAWIDLTEIGQQGYQQAVQLAGKILDSNQAVFGQQKPGAAEKSVMLYDSRFPGGWREDKVLDVEALRQAIQMNTEALNRNRTNFSRVSASLIDNKGALQQFGQLFQSLWNTLNPGEAGKSEGARELLFDERGRMTLMTGLSSNVLSQVEQMLGPIFQKYSQPNLTSVKELSPNQLARLLPLAQQYTQKLSAFYPGYQQEHQGDRGVLLTKNNELLGYVGVSMETLRLAMEELTDATKGIKGFYNVPSGYRVPPVHQFYEENPGAEHGPVNFWFEQSGKPVDLKSQLVDPATFAAGINAEVTNLFEAIKKAIAEATGLVVTNTGGFAGELNGAGAGFPQDFVANPVAPDDTSIGLPSEKAMEAHWKRQLKLEEEDAKSYQPSLSDEDKALIENALANRDKLVPVRKSKPPGPPDGRPEGLGSVPYPYKSYADWMGAGLESAGKAIGDWYEATKKWMYAPPTNVREGPPKIGPNLWDLFWDKAGKAWYYMTTPPPKPAKAPERFPGSILIKPSDVERSQQAPTPPPEQPPEPSASSDLEPVVAGATAIAVPAPHSYTTSLGRGSEFTKSLLPLAAATSKNYGGLVPAEAVLAIAANDTGWGSSTLGSQYFNLFGIKGTGPAGSVSMPTWEEVNGKRVDTTAQFRAYHNVEEALDDFAQLVTTSSRYKAGVQAAGGDLTKFMQALYQGGYATDSNWVQKVLKIAGSGTAPAASAYSPTYVAGKLSAPDATFGYGAAKADDRVVDALQSILSRLREIDTAPWALKGTYDRMGQVITLLGQIKTALTQNPRTASNDGYNGLRDAAAASGLA